MIKFETWAAKIRYKTVAFLSWSAKNLTPLSLQTLLPGLQTLFFTITMLWMCTVLTIWPIKIITVLLFYRIMAAWSLDLFVAFRHIQSKSDVTPLEVLFQDEVGWRSLFL